LTQVLQPSGSSCWCARRKSRFKQDHEAIGLSGRNLNSKQDHEAIGLRHRTIFAGYLQQTTVFSFSATLKSAIFSNPAPHSSIWSRNQPTTGATCRSQTRCKPSPSKRVNQPASLVIRILYFKFWLVEINFGRFLMNFDWFFGFWRMFFSPLDLLLFGLGMFVVCVCLWVRASFDRFWPNDKFRFLGFSFFWGHFLSRFLPNSLKNHWKVNFFIGFSDFEDLGFRA